MNRVTTNNNVLKPALSLSERPYPISECCRARSIASYSERPFLCAYLHTGAWPIFDWRNSVGQDLEVVRLRRFVQASFAACDASAVRTECCDWPLRKTTAEQWKMLVLKSGVDLYFLTRSVSEETLRIQASLTLRVRISSGP